MSTMRRRTKLLTCALVGTIIFMLLHSKYFRQKTVALLEPVQLVDLLNRKELINAEPPDGTIIQTASVYGERSATEMDERIKLPVQLVGVDNLTPIIITQIKNDGSDVPHIKDRSVEAVPQIKDRSVEAVTQIKDHVEAVTQRIQSVEVLTQTRDQGIEQISVEAVTQTIDQGVEEPVTQIKDQHAEDMTQIKEGDPDRNLIPSTVTSDQSINTLHPTRTSVPMHQTTQHPLSLLSALHAPPSFPWLPEERTEQVMLLGWIKDLQSFLTTVDVCCPIAIVTSDSRYANALLNWLILSTVKLEDPIKNTLVLSLDSSLHQLLQNRSIKSLHITPSSLSTIKHDRFHAMKQVEVVRLTVMRLLNYWGFDIANYDSDAMILKNPQPIYDRFSDKDVIGSAGYFPFEIHKTWGVTLCMGVVMIRATKQTELLWNALHRVGSPDDQVKMNRALYSFHITWDERNSKDSPRHGRGSSNLTVTILPMSWVCRGPLGCRKRSMDSYYIWHRGGGHSYDRMLKATRDKGKWFLRPNWKEVSSQNSLKGSEWLQSISEDTVQRT